MIDKRGRNANEDHFKGVLGHFYKVVTKTIKAKR